MKRLLVLLLVGLTLFPVSCRKKERPTPREIPRPAPTLTPPPYKPPTPEPTVKVTPRAAEVLRPKKKRVPRAVAPRRIGGVCDYFISPTGSDAGSGSTSSRWSIQRGMTNASGVPEPGKEICMESGDYLLTTDLVISLTGTAANRIKVRPETLGGRVRIMPVNNTTLVALGTILGAYTDFYWIEGSGIAGCDRISEITETGGYPGITCPHGFVIRGHNIRTYRMIMHDGGLTGFYAGNQSTNPGSQYEDGGPRDYEQIGSISYHNGLYKPFAVEGARAHGASNYGKNAVDSLGNATWRYYKQNINFNSSYYPEQWNGGDTMLQIVKMAKVGGANFNSGVIWSQNQTPLVPYAFQTSDSGGPAEGSTQVLIDGSTFYEEDPPNPATQTRDAPTFGSFTIRARDIEIRNSRFYFPCRAVQMYYYNGFKFTGNKVESRGVGLNCNSGSYSRVQWDKRWQLDPDGDGVPPPTLTRDWGNTVGNSYYFNQNSGFCMYPGSGGCQTFANWKANFGHDALSTLTIGRAPAESWTEMLDGYPFNGNIFIYNPSLAATAQVDISGFQFQHGQGYKMRDSQDLFGTPVLTGTYDSGNPIVTVAVNRTTVSAILGTGVGLQQPTHTTYFNAYIIEPTDFAGTPTPTPASSNTPTSTLTNTPTRTPTLTTTTTPSVTPTATPTPSSYTCEAFEAESLTLTAPMVTAVDVLASGAQYITSNVANSGLAELTYNKPVPGSNTMFVWGRVLAADSDHDSFRVGIDGEPLFTGETYIWDLCEGCWGPSWVWRELRWRDPVKNTIRRPVLSQGAHDFDIGNRDPDSKLDVVLFTNNPAFVPSGTFGGCTEAPTATPTTTATWTRTQTPSHSPTRTFTPSHSATPTVTRTRTPTFPPGFTPSPTQVPVVGTRHFHICRDGRAILHGHPGPRFHKDSCERRVPAGLPDN